MLERPIAAFYACYLLRSTVRRASLYVGSTPNPRRRLRQHNGDVPGGATSTAKSSLRPWEMVLLVTGFPSKIAALQFEWAWQNAHMTRHISTDSRLSRRAYKLKFSPRTGRHYRRPVRVRATLSERLGNLHLLLRSSSFERWPLSLTFFAEDVHRAWLRWTTQHAEMLRDTLDVDLEKLELPIPAGNGHETQIARGVDAVDVTYSLFKPRLEKSNRLFADTEWLECGICRQGLLSGGMMALICPNDGCAAMFHMKCLASDLLSSDRDGENVVPITGKCPACNARLKWVDLVKELSLRMRGEKEVAALFKKRRRPKGDASVLLEAENENATEDDETYSQEEMNDGWHQLSESGEEKVDNGQERQLKAVNARHRAEFATLHTDIAIDDSEWDEAQVVT